MLHAPRPGRRHLLPVLLVSACTAAFGGLVALAPAAAEKESVLSYSAQERSIPVLAPVERERSVARASRTRQIAETERARVAAAVKAKAAAAAKAKAAAEAAAKARADAEAAAEAEQEAAEEAEQEAAAEAEQEAEAEAEAEQESSSDDSGSTAVSSGGACPVPSASFTDTWGAPRSGGRSHKGTDMMAPNGSPVYAASGGTVRSTSSAAGGISLYLDADNGETYFYAHNSANVASSGQRVEAGELIAKVGSSGNASGGASHVHFERQVGGGSVNPYPFLRRLCG